MEIRHLRYFVAIAEAGSLMKASERLHVAQPALSVHLSNLEVELGVRLVQRSNRGVTLTDEGELLYDRAVTLLRYHEEAIMTLRTRKVRAEGNVSIGLPSTLPGLITPRLFQAMREEIPAVSLYMVDASTAALYEWLQAGKIDFAILFSVPDDVGLVVTPLYMEDFCLVGPPGPHGCDDIDFDDVPGHPLIMPCAATSWRKILDLAAERRGIELTSHIETESMSALRAAALSGVCHAILPRSCVHDDVREGRLAARRIVNPDLKGLKSIAQVSNRPLTAAQRSVRDIVCRIVRETMDEMNHDIRPSAKIAQISPTALFQKSRRRPHLRVQGS